MRGYTAAIVALLVAIGPGRWVGSSYAADVPLAPAPYPMPAAVPAPPPPQPSPPNIGDSFEARFGAYAAGIGSAEKGTVDLNATLLSPRLNIGLPGYWANLLPRFRIGGAANLMGRTSFAYADIAMTLPVMNWFYVEPFFGGAIHNGSLTPTSTLAGLGCPMLFHVGGSVGVPITEHWSVLGTFEHLSNGRGIFGVNCGTNWVGGGNQGLNNYGVSASYAF